MHKFRSVVGLGVLVLVGCGGGGDGGSFMRPLVAITADNAESVVAAAYHSLNSAMRFDDYGFTENTPLFATAETAKGSNYAVLAQRQLARVLGKGGKADHYYRPFEVPESEPEECSISGTVKMTLNVADDDWTPSKGDSFTISYSDCWEQEGTYNGTIKGSVIEFSGSDDDLPYRMKMSFEFDDLRFDDSTEPFSERADGRFIFWWYEDDDRAETGSNIESFDYSYTHGDKYRRFVYQNYKVSTVFDRNEWKYSTTVDGMVDASELEGSIRIETKDPFVGSFRDMGDWIHRDHPTSGELWLHGANGSKVQVTAQGDGEGLLVNYDEDGDGEWDNEEGIELYWAELRPF